MTDPQAIQQTIAIVGSDGQPMVTIHLDNQHLEYGPGYHPDEAARAFWDALQRMATGSIGADQHECRLYFCPEANEIESPCHSGFGRCCDQPEAHVPMPDDPSTEVVSQALSNAAKRAYRLQCAIDRVEASCTRLAPEQPDPIETAVAYSQGWNDALDAVQRALYIPREA